MNVDDLSGKEYVDFNEWNIDDLDIGISQVLDDLLEKVTYNGHIHRDVQIRTKGVYRHQEAILTVTDSFLRDGSDAPETYFKVIGPSLKSIQVIYTLFRQGKLTPNENWEVITDRSGTHDSGRDPNS